MWDPQIPQCWGRRVSKNWRDKSPVGDISVVTLKAIRHSSPMMPCMPWFHKVFHCSVSSGQQLYQRQDSTWPWSTGAACPELQTLGGSRCHFPRDSCPQFGDIVGRMEITWNYQGFFCPASDCGCILVYLRAYYRADSYISDDWMPVPKYTKVILARQLCKESFSMFSSNFQFDDWRNSLLQQNASQDQTRIKLDTAWASPSNSFVDQGSNNLQPVLLQR